MDECSVQDSVNISEKIGSSWLYNPADTVIITVIIPTMLCLGVTTSSIFLFVIFRVPSMRSDTNTYLVNLAVADLLYLSLSGSFYVWAYAASPVVFQYPFANSATCVSFFAITHIAYYAATALVTTVTYERYLALCHTLKHYKIRGRRRTNRMVAICWLVGLIFAILLLPRVAIHKVLCVRWPDNDVFEECPPTIAYCGSVHPLVEYLSPILNIPWLIAMLGNVYMYIRIIRSLNERRKGKGGVKHDQKALQIRNQVAKMLVVNGVVLFLCQTPYTMTNLTKWICLLADIPSPISALGKAEDWMYTIPELINTSVNPLIYSAMIAQFRAALLQAFPCKDRPRETRVRPALKITSRFENQNLPEKTLGNKNSNESQL